MTSTTATGFSKGEGTAERAQAERRAGEAGRGRTARTPSELPAKGWKDILWRVFAEISEDRVMLVAAGVTFYMLLALFPALTALVSVYGIYADPANLADQLVRLQGLIPASGMDILTEQLKRLVTAESSSLSVAFFSGLALSLWSANAGIKTLFDAMNIAYGEQEKRSFIMLNIQSLGFTLGAIFIILVFLSAVVAVPALLALVPFGSTVDAVISLLRWPIIVVIAAAAIALLYRFGPSRRPMRWRWVSWGSVITAVAWTIVSILFSWYLANFANYNATYGSLGAVIGMMMWIWVSVLVLLVGAELNAEMEHQTAIDTTQGGGRPLGGRGAAMADTVGVSSDSDADHERGEGTDREVRRRDGPPRNPPPAWLLAVVGAGALVAAARRRRD